MSDPSSPEWRPYVDAHLDWWEQVWRLQLEGGRRVTSLTPEAGPPSYQHTLPHSGGRVSCDIHQANNWLLGRVRERYREVVPAVDERRGAEGGGGVGDGGWGEDVRGEEWGDFGGDFGGDGGGDGGGD